MSSLLQGTQGVQGGFNQLTTTLAEGSGIQFTYSVGTDTLTVSASGLDVRNSTANITYYPLFVDSSGWKHSGVIRADSPAVSFNPSTRALTNIMFSSYTETTTTATIATSVLNIDLSLTNIFLVNLNSNITGVNITNAASSGNAHGFSVIFTADGTQRTITWPTSIKWPGGSSPTMTSTNGKRDVLNFVTTDGGATFLSFIAGQNF